MIQDPLAMLLLEGKFSDGDTVEVGVKGDALTFEKSKQRASASVA